MATLGPQIVSQSYGNLLKFLPTGDDGVTTNQVQITDGKGKVTPLYLATGSVLVDNEFTASADVVFSGLTQATQTNIVCIDGSGRLYFQNSASFQDNDWTVGPSYMTASGQTSVYIPGKLEQGEQTQAIGLQSHAQGVETVAQGDRSHAEGKGTLASDALAHAEGHYTTASGFFAHSEGDKTLASNTGAHSEGQYTTASGAYSHAEGDTTQAVGTHSHAEGTLSVAQGNKSHAEGKGTLAFGAVSHAEGHYTTASGFFAHSEGDKTLASNTGAHSEGQSSKANGRGSHAEGKKTTAQADNSHAGGLGTWANKEDQTVVGQYNVFNQALGPFHDSTFVVGTGTSDSQRADGLTVKRNTHEVAVMQQLSPNYLNYSEYNGPGLYFGRPEEAASTRIISFQQVAPGTILFQAHDGNEYIDMVQILSSATFIPD